MKFVNRIALAIALIGASPALAGTPAGEVQLARPGAPVFATVEAAAVNALRSAHQRAGGATEGRLRFGTIYRSERGFRFSPPRRSLGSVWSSRRPVLRLALGPADVATYIVHPRSGEAVLDRENESLHEGERRVVDELDAEGRPLFVLTPSLRVLRYGEGQVSELQDLAGGRR